VRYCEFGQEPPREMDLVVDIAIQYGIIQSLILQCYTMRKEWRSVESSTLITAASNAIFQD
jgi:hypothetical protein